MDYSKSGNVKGPKGAPRHREHNAPGGPKNPFNSRPSKAELVARLKANAEKAKKPD